MPSLNFKRQFADAVQSGQKRQTIRARRKREWKVGDTLYLFTDMRIGTCKRIGQATLKSVQKIAVIAQKREVHLEKAMASGGSYLARLSDEEALDLALADGFATLDDFFAFFAQIHGRSFGGHLLRW